VTSKLAAPNAPLGYTLCFLNLFLDGYTNAAQVRLQGCSGVAAVVTGGCGCGCGEAGCGCGGAVAGVGVGLRGCSGG